MAVSKRTRFEVLKRDNYTCRYCRSTESALTVDHVTPVALGGTDDPSNLVAACRDCNAGKGSTAPDAGTVEDVKNADIFWAKAIARAAEIRAGERADEMAFLDAFEEVWGSRWAPTDAADTIAQLRNAGLPLIEIQDAARIALAARNIQDRWRYFCGVAWNKVRKLQEVAKALVEAEAVGD